MVAIHVAIYLRKNTYFRSDNRCLNCTISVVVSVQVHYTAMDDDLAIVGLIFGTKKLKRLERNRSIWRKDWLRK